LPEGGGTIGAALMAEHRSYRATVASLLDSGLVQGMAHVTGGGLRDNLPRTLPEDCIARLDPAAWPVPPIFRYLIERGGVGAEEQHRVFNMGVGFVLVVRETDAGAALAQVPDALRIGEIVPRVTSDEAAVQGLTC
jgi:phosphoribosylformylglycinamidine cyclo-ligase